MRGRLEILDATGERLAFGHASFDGSRAIDVRVPILREGKPAQVFLELDDGRRVNQWLDGKVNISPPLFLGIDVGGYVEFPEICLS